MSGYRPFTRQLGLQPGIQLNPPIDLTDGVVPDKSDQVVGAFARLTRGRIDRPFRTTRANLTARTGLPESLRTNPLNETKLQIYEALNRGSASAVLMRMTSASAKKLYAVINLGAQFTTVSYSVSADKPSGDFSMYLMHHDCHNDGIFVQIHADATPVGGDPQATNEITLRILDSAGQLLHTFKGSLDKEAKDDFGKSAYLPDVIASRTESVTLVVAESQSIAVASPAYGRSATGKDNWATSEKLICFTEGGTTYTTTDEDRWIAAMRDTMLPYGTLITGGHRSTSWVRKIGDLGIETNTSVKIDVPGDLDPEAAIKWRSEIGYSAWFHFNWCPQEADDPMNGGRALWGAGGLQAGYTCARNARTNAKGFAPKTSPISGKAWPLARAAVRQIYTPRDDERSDLAAAQINPVLYDTFNAGGDWVITDCLTGYNSRVSYLKLQTVQEMSSHLDNVVALAAKEFSQKPMEEFIDLMDKFMGPLLENAQAAKWLKPAENLPGNAAFSYQITPDEAQPADLVHVIYYCSYDGVARQGHVQQYITK